MSNNNRNSYTYSEWEENLAAEDRAHEMRAAMHKQKTKLRQMNTPQINTGRSLKNNIRRESHMRYADPNRLEKLAQQYYPERNMANAIPNLLEKEPYAVEGIGKSTVKPPYNNVVIPIINSNTLEEKEIIEEMKKYWGDVRAGVIERNSEYEEYMKLQLDDIINRNYNYTAEAGRRTRRARRKTRKGRAQRKTLSRRN
jgi:hypothetical protein